MKNQTNFHNEYIDIGPIPDDLTDDNFNQLKLFLTILTAGG